MQISSYVNVLWIDEKNPDDSGITQYRNMTNEDAYTQFKADADPRYRVLGFQTYTTPEMDKKRLRRKSS